MVVELIGHAIYPPPSSLRADDPEAIRAYIEQAPFLALAAATGGRVTVSGLGTASLQGDVRFADVLELTHPSPRVPWQGDLFRHAIDRRHDRPNAIPESLGVLRARAALTALPVDDRRAALDPERLRAAGMTWESVAGWLQGPVDADAWTALIPGFVVAGLGMGAQGAVVTQASLAAVEPARAGMATGVVNTMRQLGVAVGVAVWGVVFQARVGDEVTSQLAGTGVPSRELADAVGTGAGLKVLSAVPEPLRAAVDAAVRAAGAAGISERRLQGLVFAGF